MPFEVVKPRRGTWLRDRVRDRVRAGVFKSKSAPHVRIAIGGRIAERLGWQRGQTVTVQRGTGRDIGRIVLQRGPGFKLTDYGKTGASLRIHVPAWPPMTGGTRPSEDCAYRIARDGAEGATLTITLPAWAGRPAKGFTDIDDDTDAADRRGAGRLPRSPAPAAPVGQSSLGGDQT